MKCVRLCVLLAFVVACQSVPDTPSRLILGTWESGVGGFPVLHEYNESTVRISGHGAIAYRLEEDLLTIDSEGASNRVVSFPSANEMHQTDPLTGSVHKFSRVR